ncbi:Filament-like plant protein 6 [Camellia lanceoleosa]|uniref:Filament-like plant protein 6 n=1 Tax=Camellia lanceoleosa TaxID=1840588 RepID=A0ACC0GTQ4_9ERIC|nr:Filament-like plant protein 6 [Camellia lanceoleosa]
MGHRVICAIYRLPDAHKHITRPPAGVIFRRRQDTPGSISGWHLGDAAHRLVANSPSPAALAQMKLEVKNLGWDYGETRVRRSLLKHPSPLPPQLSDFSLDSVPKFYKENDFLTERLLAMEEETKMLKKALC